MTTLGREISARIFGGSNAAFKRSITRKISFVTHHCSPPKELSGVDVLTDDRYDFIRDREFDGDRCASTIDIVVG